MTQSTKAPPSHGPDQKYEKKIVTPIERVKFTDGMIVTADDLDTAMHYPTALLKTALRSYFGCGVVCGLNLKKDPRAGKSNTYALCIDSGVAFDCHGYPLELCGGIKLDLTPDPCLPGDPPDLYIAIRRTTADEAAHDPCTCDTSDDRYKCTRIRDIVVVKAFVESEIDGTFCATGEAAPQAGRTDCGGGTGDQSANSTQTIEELCNCLKSCTTCDCAAESWVVLGKVVRSKEKGKEGIVDVLPDRRRYVKPIECYCRGIPELPKLADRIEDLEKDKAKLENQIDELAKLVASYHTDNKPV